MFNMTPVTPEEQESLEAICQTNGWLKRGGFDWQDDPYMEEYPYEFDRCFSMDDLSEFFQHGNWAIRQGVVYGDLAFIQQVNAGDEWWTLKQDADGSWIPFESISFARIAQDRSDLVRHVAGMRLATVEECKRYEYLPDKTDLTWSGNAFPYLDDGYVRARNDHFLISVEANHMGKMLSITGPSEEYLVDQSQDDMTLLQTINAQVKAAAEYAHKAMNPSLSERAQDAIEASNNQDRIQRTQDSRANER